MDTLQLNIKRFYTDMNGVTLNKAAVPVTFQKKFPFFLFNTMDKNAGFRNGLIVKPVADGVFYLYSYIVGLGYNFLDFQIGNDVKNNFRNGDLIHVFGDDATLPNFLSLIQVSSDYQGYAGVLDNMKDISFNIEKYQYFTNNPLNWQESVAFIQQDNLGVYAEDSHQPISYRNAYIEQPNMVEITLPLEVTDKKGLASHILFATDYIQLNFEFSSIVSKLNSQNNGSNANKAVLFRVD